MKNIKKKIITTFIVVVTMVAAGGVAFAVHAITPTAEEKLEKNRDLRVALRQEQKELKASCEANDRYIYSKIKTLEAEADMLKAAEGL